MGGMGEAFPPVMEKLSSEFEFYVVGYPLGNLKPPACVKEYRGIVAPLPNISFGPLATMISQLGYFTTAIGFPRPDIVYAYDWSVYLAAVETARYFKAPLICRMCLSATLYAADGYTFGLDLSVSADKALHESFCRMEVKGLSLAARIVQISEGYAKRFEHIKEFSEKTSVVPNGIDLKVWQGKDTAEPFKFPGTRKRKVVYIGRLTQMKGVLALAAAPVPDDIDLIFIGSKEGSEPRCLQAIADKSAREGNTHYIGPLYGKDKIRALRSADAIVIPTFHEAFGVVGLEGLAAECIVLSSRIGGLADYLTEETSIYCGTTPATIGQALKTFSTFSPARAKKMRQAGLEVCKRYAIESTAEKLGNVFRSVVTRGL